MIRPSSLRIVSLVIVFLLSALWMDGSLTVDRTGVLEARTATYGQLTYVTVETLRGADGALADRVRTWHRGPLVATLVLTLIGMTFLARTWPLAFGEGVHGGASRVST